MKQRRRLRNLVPDDALIRRRAAGEPLRELAADYGVAHTTLLRFFERPEVAREIKHAEGQLRAEQRALADRRADERRFEQQVRRQAKEQGALERRQALQADAAAGEIESRPRRSRRSRSSFAAWLDERDAREPLRRIDLYSQNDEIAAGVVAEGGGIQEVLEATDLRTLENVTNLIDPAILKRAYDNDLLRQSPQSARSPVSPF